MAAGQQGIEISGCFIRMVNGLLRDGYQDKYTPQYVSVGPHYMNSDLLRREDEKETNLQEILQKAGYGDPAARKSDWKGKLNSHVDMAAGYYRSASNSTALNEETTLQILTSLSKDMTREKFLDMLLEDGCYILSKFVPKHYDAARGGQQDPQVLQLIEHDVIYLAENQIPFFILEEINEIIGWCNPESLVPAFCSYIEKHVLEYHGYAIGKRYKETPRPSHLLHLLHILLIGDQPRTEMAVQVPIEAEAPANRVMTNFLRWHRATQYEMAHVDLAGVDLISISKGSRGSACPSRSILDVNLQHCGMRLEFPSLYVDHETWCILRNLIALEQSNPKTLQHRVTAYCMLMSQLACTAEDVELLARRRVTDHLMPTPKACAECFAKLCTRITFDLDDDTLNYLRDACVKLDRRYRSRPSQWTAWMLREYFRNPFIAVGSVLALIFTASGVLQAVYTVLKLAGKLK